MTAVAQCGASCGAGGASGVKWALDSFTTPGLCCCETKARLSHLAHKSHFLPLGKYEYQVFKAQAEMLQRRDQSPVRDLVGK